MRFVVTAGPTREYLDPVRFLSNPSTGRMGFAVARAAHQAGCQVVLVAGPVVLRTPTGVVRRNVVSARDMLAAVLEELRRDSEDVCLVMTAAVADWRPAEQATEKLKKHQMTGTLQLVRNPDILKTIQQEFIPQPQQKVIKVGFAAETDKIQQEAARKCSEKGLDWVIGNNVKEIGCGFGTVTNRTTWVYPDGRIEEVKLMRKDALARRIVQAALKLCAEK